MIRLNLKMYIVVALAITLLTSCVTTKKLNYLQKVDGKEIPSYEKIQSEMYRIKPGDELFIKFTPVDADLGEYFSEERTSNYFNTEASISISSYLVYDDGTIDFPLIGIVNVNGLTTREVKEKIEKECETYFEFGGKVTVKLVNNYISVLGEVKLPGRYVIYKESTTIFQAIALAGDIQPYGDRQRVRIIRESAYGPIVKEFDLRSEDIVNSEFYLLQPNDVIYVSRIPGQFFKFDSFPSIMSTVSSSVSVLLLAINTYLLFSQSGK